MDWITTAYGLVTLIGACFGLIGTAIGTFFSIKNWISKNKEKTRAEQWALLMTMADSAMKEAEASGKSGVDKKTMVMNIIKESCKAGGLNVDDFIDQLNAYIDNSIAWYNGMKR